MCPYLFTSIVDLSCKVHIDTPIIWIPRDLPVEVQTAQNLKSDIEPEARSTDSSRSGVPSALLDQCSGTSNMVHALQSSFTHDLVDIKDHGSSGANDGVSIRVLEILEQVSCRSVVVIQCLLFGVNRVDESQMASSASKECIEQHWLLQGVKW